MPTKCITTKQQSVGECQNNQREGDNKTTKVIDYLNHTSKKSKLIFPGLGE